MQLQCQRWLCSVSAKRRRLSTAAVMVAVAIMVAVTGIRPPDTPIVPPTLTGQCIGPHTFSLRTGSASASGGAISSEDIVADLADTAVETTADIIITTTITKTMMPYFEKRTTRNARQEFLAELVRSCGEFK